MARAKEPQLIRPRVVSGGEGVDGLLGRMTSDVTGMRIDLGLQGRAEGLDWNAASPT